MAYDKSYYYIDFSERENLTKDEKSALENLQTTLRPIERIDYLLDYVINDKITEDDFETMTGLEYGYRDNLL